MTPGSLSGPMMMSPSTKMKRISAQPIPNTALPYRMKHSCDLRVPCFRWSQSLIARFRVPRAVTCKFLAGPCGTGGVWQGARGGATVGQFPVHPLINKVEYQLAEEILGPHAEGIAHELGGDGASGEGIATHHGSSPLTATGLTHVVRVHVQPSRIPVEHIVQAFP